MTQRWSNADGIAVAEVNFSQLSAQRQTASTKATEPEVPFRMAALPGTREKTSGMHPRAIMFLLLWYFWSGCTLFLNKYVVFFMKGDPTFLACSQMWMTMLLGFVQLYYPLGMYEPVERKKIPKKFYQNMMIVGSLRFITVLLGLVALNYVEVSFTETVKSTAPAFTVVISRLMVGEVTGFYVNLSLIPVMGGLALCSANELSFHILGFLAAIGTNVSECVQNVFSKMLISGDAFKYSPAEMQFYTSLFSLGVQLPSMLFLLDDPVTFFTSSNSLSKEYLWCCVLNGVFFHFQTMSAYVLMDFISPVTHSVANTAKRALLIWLSVILFGNAVTPLSALGTAVVIGGVLMYNKAREIDGLNAVVRKQKTPRTYSVAEATDS